jgi:hypothetical protein
VDVVVDEDGFATARGAGDGAVNVEGTREVKCVVEKLDVPGTREVESVIDV